MGKIKSAWEIALEKTADIKLDKDKYQHNADIDNARRIAGSYLVDEDKTKEETEKALLSINKEAVKEALTTTILQSITLPQDEILDDRYERLVFIASLASDNKPEVMDLIGQIVPFLKQYPQHKKDLIEKMKEQYRPMMEEKEARLSQQYGQPVKLRIENDKDFLDMASTNLERLQDQYEKTVADAKEQLKALLS